MKLMGKGIKKFFLNGEKKEKGEDYVRGKEREGYKGCLKVERDSSLLYFIAFWGAHRLPSQSSTLMM